MEQYVVLLGDIVKNFYESLRFPMYKRSHLFFLTVTALVVFFCVGTLFAQVPRIIPAQGVIAADDVEESDDDAGNTDSASDKKYESDRLLTHQERSVVRRIEQTELLIERERFTEAMQLIANLFEQTDDRFVKPSEAESSNPTNHTTQRDQIIALFNRLPEKSRQLYVTQWEPQAQRLLEIAVREQSVAKVENVAAKYPMTESGRDALFLIGMTHWSNGAKAAALRIFTGLSANSPNPQKYEPELTLNIINSQQSLGLTAEASKTAETFFTRFKTPRLTRSDGSIWTPESPDDLLNVLVSDTSSPDVSRWIDNVGWLLPKGTAWQNVSVNASEPILEKNWFVPSTSEFQIEQQLQRIQQAFWKLRNTVNLPASEPIIVRDTLLVRGYNEILAINSRNGKRIWRASEPEYVIPKIGNRVMRFSNDFYNVQSRSQESMIRFLFWFDRLYNGITSDGKRVFHIDGNSLATTHGIGRLVPIQDGGLSMEDPRNTVANTLCARDVETGKLLWSVGKHPFAQKKFDEFAERVNDANQRKETERRRKEEERRNDAKKKNNANDVAENKDSKEGNKEDNKPAEKPFVPSVVFTENEKILGEQTFLGAPLPVQDRLFVVAESGGTIRLLILDAATGNLIKQQPIVDPPNPFENDYLRRFYSATPSYSNGLVICPTGVGVIAAFDSLTAEPVWCFQYVKENEKKDGEQQNWNMRGVPLAMISDQLVGLLATAGWQIPSIIIDGNRVTVAPADQPVLFCLDLLTGDAVWGNKEMSRTGMLYVAGIHNGKIITVTPESLVAIDITNGEPLWNDSALRLQVEQRPGRHPILPPAMNPVVIPRALPVKKQQPANNEQYNSNKETEPRKELVTLALPKDVKPSGRGILDDNRYYLPMSDESIAILNLDEVKLESVRKPTASFYNNAANSANSVFTNALGNLIALRGKFFSKSPFGVVCFDQKESLAAQTQTRLAANPADAEALFDSGRIVYSEGKLPEAIDLVKRSVSANNSRRTLSFLRDILLSAIRIDFKSYQSYYDELLSLAVSPTEKAETLLVFANGARENDDNASFFASLEKLVRIDQQSPTMTLRVDQDRSVRLSRIIGEQTSAGTGDAKTNSPRQQLRSQIESLANNIYEQIAAGKTFGDIDQITETESDRLFDLAWNEDAKTVNNPYIQAWRLFLDYFPDLPIASRAKQKLFEVCENTNQYLTLELLGSETPDWFGSGINLTGENPLANEEVPPRKVDVVKTPKVPSRDAASMILKLAKLTYDKSVALQREDLLTDSLYGYRMLIDAYPAEKDLTGAAAEALKSKYYEYIKDTDNWTVNGANDEVEGGGPIATLKGAGMLHQVQNANYNYRGYLAIPHLGSWNPYFSNKTFRYENFNQQNKFAVVCQDERGLDRWFLQLPQTDNENHYVMDTSAQHEGVTQIYSYFRSLGHLLFLIRGKQIIAIDTLDWDESGSPKILWEKSREAILATYLPLNGQPINELRDWGNRLQHAEMVATGGMFAGNNVYVSPKAVCYQTMGTIIAVDPLTGQMLWQRRCESMSEELTGDNETLFRVLMDSHEVIAVDPASGKEISRSKLPDGTVIYLFENNLVLLTSDASYKLEAIDLRTMLQPVNERKLALKLPTDFHQVAVHRFNPIEIRSGLTDNSVVRFVHHGRFVATLNVQSKTLKIFDLTSKVNVCRPIKVETIKDEEQNNGWGTDFEVQFRNDKILVMYIPRRYINNDGKSLQQRQYVRGVPSRSVGLGTVMLYDRDAKPQWEKPVEINNWFYFTKTPSCLPVLMFGVLERPRDYGGIQYQTAIKLIDKTTGKEIFSRTLKRITSKNQGETYIHSFRVYAQKQSEDSKGSIHLYSQSQQASYRFDLSDEPTKPITDQEKKPKTFNFDFELNWN
ncbi:MAG: PQQ-binding-like beta-propeller repeat protein [Planctomycetaceae bacterium]|jgi:outer membrane protein assembly factor BamB|nr:PQQ-binding-like beta-propeller repeat protein [Planctomycetaceae bacterium]